MIGGAEGPLVHPSERERPEVYVPEPVADFLEADVLAGERVRDADIEFPSMEQAQGWYESDAYRAIRPLRTERTDGDVFLVQGVPEGHRGADILG